MQTLAELQGIYDSVFLGDRRAPITKVLMFDQTDTFSNIVLGNVSQVPLDITKYVTDCKISENDESAATASLTVIPDPLAEDPLTPYHFVGRRIIQILYTDELTQAEFGASYIPLFTGPVKGQPGYRRNRESNEKIITVQCVDRSFFYNKRKLNTPDYFTGEDLGDIAIDIATDTTYGMGLQREECKFGLFRHTVQHSKMAIFDESYMTGLSNIGFIVDVTPAWDGGGHLIMRDTSLDKPPVRRYQDEECFIEITWPDSNVDLYNDVKIIGLSNVITRVTSPFQELFTANGTLGYFEDKYKKRIYFSDDRQARATGIQIMEHSMNGQLGGIIGEGKARIKNVDEFSCVLQIETPYEDWVFIAFFSGYIAFFAASTVIGALTGGLLGDAVNMAAAAFLTTGLAVMQELGTFETTVGGYPYKLVYQEIEGEAYWEHLQEYEKRLLTIENHLVHDQDLADDLAYREMIREKVKQNTRSVTMPHDPFLQVSDIVELPDGTRYYFKSISRSFKRGEPQNMNVEALMCRSGKEYNGETGFSEY